MRVTDSSFEEEGLDGLVMGVLFPDWVGFNSVRVGLGSSFETEGLDGLVIGVLFPDWVGFNSVRVGLGSSFETEGLDGLVTLGLWVLGCAKPATPTNWKAKNIIKNFFIAL